MLRDQKNSTLPVKEAMQESKIEFVKNRKECKMIFFGILGHLESENLKLMKVRQNPDAYCQIFADPDHVLWFFRISYGDRHKSISRQQLRNLTFLSLEDILGTKTKTKRIQGSCYRGNNTQRQRKTKRNRK